MIEFSDLSWQQIAVLVGVVVAFMLNMAAWIMPSDVRMPVILFSLSALVGLSLYSKWRAETTGENYDQ